jgi:hypothetical protein
MKPKNSPNYEAFLALAARHREASPKSSGVNRPTELSGTTQRPSCAVAHKKVGRPYGRPYLFSNGVFQLVGYELPYGLGTTLRPNVLGTVIEAVPPKPSASSSFIEAKL